MGPAGALATAGARLCLGSDSHAVIDLFEEARAVELDERLATLQRGVHRAGALLAAATQGGATSLGWPQCGRIEAGALADLVTVSVGSVRLAGIPADALVAGIVFAATAGDVTDVMVGGTVVVRGRHHVTIDVPSDLRRAIEAVWQ
ncbi:MAG TPA: amidohydrolase family protein [Acidimicrobiales bacterium]